MAEEGLRELLGAANDVLDGLGAVPLSVVSAEDLSFALIELQSLTARVDAFRGRVAARADVVLFDPESGVRDAAQVVGRDSNGDQAECRADVRLAGWLVDFPVFAAAFAAGLITSGHVAKLRKLDKARTHQVLVDQQQFLVDKALEVDFKQFDQVVQYWLNAADPDGDEPKEKEREMGCRYKQNSDGSVSGSFRLDPVSGQAFADSVERECEKIRDEETNGGEGVPTRSRFRRTGEAVMRLIARGAARPDGSYPVPLVSIVMSQTVAESIVDAATTGSAPDAWPVDVDDLDGRCEFEDGTPVHPLVAGEVLSVALFRRYVFDSAGRPVEMASTARLFPEPVRRLLRIMSRGRCSVPGCDAPIWWLQADHVVPASRGGPTTLSNGQMLCGAHNRMKGNRHTKEGRDAAA